MDKVIPVLGEGEIDPMEALLHKAEADRDKALAKRDLAIAERDFARQQYSDIGRLLRQERESFSKEMRKACERHAKSIVNPTLWFSSFVTLAFIVQILVEYQLVSPLLGEPLSYICLFICALFLGVMFERISVKRKKKHRYGKD